jgi:hypothetical protein
MCRRTHSVLDCRYDSVHILSALTPTPGEAPGLLFLPHQEVEPIVVLAGIIDEGVT